MPSIFLSAVEPSGDMLADWLEAGLRRVDPGVQIRRPSTGAPAPAMGLDPVWSGLEWLQHGRRVIHEASTCDVTVLVDGPAFHEWVGRRVRRGGPVISLGGPKIWAYRASRGPRYLRAIDALMLLFRFEAPSWRRLGADPLVVGHPMVDRLERVPSSGTKMDPGKVALLPGSRAGEVRRLAPVLAEVAKGLKEREFLVPRAPRVDLEPLLKRLRDHRLRFVVLDGEDCVLRAGRRAWVAVSAAGTATLELALCGCPVAVVHRLDPMAAGWVRRQLTTPFVALPNLVAGSSVVPEFLQERANPQVILSWVRTILASVDLREARSERLRALMDDVRVEDGQGEAARLVLSIGRRKRDTIAFSSV
ncbi:MAG: lipid-A-disaccharide synthase [Myxococcota bacterium]